MPEPIRRGYSQADPLIQAAVDPALLAHRDGIYARYLELPIDLGG
jgi:hypothetical protein